MRYPIAPCPKPRQTRSDKWKKRPCVMRFRAFADTVRLLRVAVPEGARVTFWIEMPKYWPETRKAKQDGQPHRQKPDLDNCVKALLDAMHSDDSHVAELHAVKRWSRRPGIEVETP